MLTPSQRDELATMLRRQRRAVFADVATAETDLDAVAADRESELEERAQEARFAALAAELDDRGKREIEEIDAALRRLAENRYGVCTGCAQAIPFERLRAIPATLRCIACAETPVVPATGIEAGAGHARPLPADLALLSDREVEETLREQIRADRRIDRQELRVVYRRGTVHLSGALPSEREHQELLKLLTDVNGLSEIDDHVTVNELLWTREDRSPAAEAAPSEVLAEVSPRTAQRYELIPPTTTEDIAESVDEDVEFASPVNPTADER